MALVFGAVPLDKLRLRLVDLSFLSRRVPKPSPEEACPHESNCSKDPEGSAPSYPADHNDDDGRRHGATQATKHPHQTGGKASFGFGHPTGEYLGGVGEHPCLTDAEKEAQYHHGPESVYNPGQRRERGPPGDDPSDHLARSNPISQPSGRDFE